MRKSQTGPDEYLNAANKLRGNQAALRQLVQSPEGKRLAALLQQGDSTTLKQTAQAAANGDANAVSQLLRQIQNNPESMKLLDQLSKKLPK